MALTGCASSSDVGLSRNDASGPGDASTLDASGKDSSRPDSRTPRPDASKPIPDSGSSSDASCVAKTCAALAAACGTVDDGCGQVLNCGGCSTPATCTDNRCVAPHTGTARQRLKYVVVAHPDDEIGAWALIEEASEDYTVFITLTQGEATGYCKNGFPGRDHVSEALPGDRADYASQTCKTLRVDRGCFLP